MPMVAIINRKGGCGKSTFAAHVAAWCARAGLAVMLGDIDRQQSSRSWLRQRESTLPPISAWAMDQKSVLRVPSGITHVVLDTPGGLHGLELARVIMSADAVVVPVGPSLFDRDSAAGCLAELAVLPRIARGQCRLVTVGMRVDRNSHAGGVLREWARQQGVEMIGMLRDSQLYPRSVERGMTLFDMAPQKFAVDRAQWAPILEWLRPVLLPAPVVQARREPVLQVRRPSVLGSRPLHAAVVA